MRKLVEMMQKEEAEKEEAADGEQQHSKDMGEGGESGQEEKIEIRGIRWADCEDGDRKEEEGREAEGKKEQEREGQGEKETVGKEKEEKEKEITREKGRKEQMESTGGARGAEESTGGARGAEESAGGARGERRRRERSRGERRRREIRKKKRGLRKSEEKKEVKAQERHDREEEKRTQEKCVEAKKEANSIHEENDVSNGHRTWWKNAWWIRVDSEPHLRTARGRRRIWRAARRAAEQARHDGRVEETQSFAEEAEGDKWRRKERRERQNKQ